MPVDTERTQTLIRKLDQLLAKTRAKPLPERVHNIRTTARRLEAVLDTLYPQQDKLERKLRKRLRRLRRRAGGVRDVDVQIGALRKLHIGRELERKTRLMQALADERSEREQKLVDALQGKGTRKLRKALQCWSAELAGTSAGQPTPAPRLSEPVTVEGETIAIQNDAPDVAAQLHVWDDVDPIAISLRMFARVCRRVGALTSENLHSYRTECKRIRYVTEMAGSQPESRHIIELLKRIQDAAGDWHDWVMLADTAEKLFARSLDSALVSALRNVMNAKFAEARGAALEARRALLAEYRAMLARQRAQKQPAPPPAGPKRKRSQRKQTSQAAKGRPARIRPKKAIAATANASVA